MFTKNPPNIGDIFGWEATGSPAPILGRSVTPIKTRDCRFCPPFTTCTANFFHHPSSLVWQPKKNYNKGLVKAFYRTESGGVACLKHLYGSPVSIMIQKYVKQVIKFLQKDCHPIAPYYPHYALLKFHEQNPVVLRNLHFFWADQD